MMVSSVSSASSANFFPALNKNSFGKVDGVGGLPTRSQEPAATFQPSSDYLAFQATADAAVSPSGNSGQNDTFTSQPADESNESAWPGTAYNGYSADDLRTRGLRYQLTGTGGYDTGSAEQEQTSSGAGGGGVRTQELPDMLGDSPEVSTTENTAALAGAMAAAGLSPADGGDAAQTAVTTDPALMGSAPAEAAAQAMPQNSTAGERVNSGRASRETGGTAQTPAAGGEDSGTEPMPVGNDSAPGGEELTDEEQIQLDELQKRDAEVRQHEQAHLAAAGGYAKGGPSYTTQRGPDGANYAIGGEVSIDTSAESTPEKTISKMATVRAAALAPAEPSSQDRAVAAEASRAAAQARQEQAQQTQEGQNTGAGEPSEASESSEAASDAGASGAESAGQEPAIAAPASASAGERDAVPESVKASQDAVTAGVSEGPQPVAPSPVPAATNRAESAAAAGNPGAAGYSGAAASSSSRLSYPQMAAIQAYQLVS